MKRYIAPSACYALAVVLWLLSIYCENRSLSLADLKTLTGDDVEGAIRCRIMDLPRLSYPVLPPRSVVG
nr:hypothetical protein [uncultured Neisseria sp.]